MTSPTPFFTIITATHNAATTLPRLLESLAAQTCRDFELIIQDGASSDNTIAVAESYRESLPALSIASEPDSGIYDAWNKALPRVRGEWVLFLGADDTLAAPSTLATVQPMLEQAPDAVLFGCGDVVWVDLSGNCSKAQACRAEGVRQTLPETIPICHSSLWHKASLLKEQLFDSRFRIAGDYEFLCRTWKDDAQGVTLGFPVAHMRRGGISDRPANCFRHRWEYAIIAARYFPGTWTDRRMWGLLKGAGVTALSFLLGQKQTPRLLNLIRRFRGLPPSWAEV